MISDAIRLKKYDNAVDSYTALSMSSKIKGVLIEKDAKNIKLDIGNNEILDIELKEAVETAPGETLLVDRKNIAKSKKIHLDEDIQLESGDVDNYSNILKTFNASVNEDNMKILKRLDSYGIDPTKENFESYLIARRSLDEISSSLDYDSAIILAELDLDLENESIQNIAEKLGEIEEEKEGFKLLDLFGKKKLSTEQAENIAQKLYGGKMGKDITDIIKSLHDKKVSITKKTVEKINDVFYKLDKLKDIRDNTFIDALKNKLDINIDNLYRVKQYAKSDAAVVSSNAKKANVKSYGFQEYNSPIQNSPKITGKTLKLLEADIVDRIELLGLKSSEENIALSKEFIKNDIDISNENIDSINRMKQALSSIIEKLDHEKAALLVKDGVDLEQEDLMAIAEKLELIDRVLAKNTASDMARPDLESGAESANESSRDQASSSEIKPSLDVKAGDNSKAGISSEGTRPAETVKFDRGTETSEDKSKENSISNPVQTPARIPSEKDAVTEIMKKLELLKKMDEGDLLTLLKSDVDFKINKIEQIIFGKQTTHAPLDGQNLVYSSEQMVNSVARITSAFKDIGNLDFRRIASQMKNSIPLTLANMQKSSQLHKTAYESLPAQEPVTIESNITIAETVRAFSRNGIEATKLNIQKAVDIYQSYNNVRNNLTGKMVSKCLDRNIEFENIDINLASKYVDQYKKANSDYETARQNYAESFNSDTSKILENSESSIMFLIRNKKPLSFGELKKANSMFKNKDQVGHKVSEFSELLSQNDPGENAEQVEVLRKSVVSISKSMERSNDEVDNAYVEFEESLKNIENNVKFANNSDDSLFREKAGELSEMMAESKRNAADNKIIQLPLYMNGQFTNLNMYFRDKKRENSSRDSDDVSAILSIDTVNMGNLNISLDMVKSNISVKVGLEKPEYQSYMEGHSKLLEDILAGIGYSVDSLSFHSEDKVSTFDAEALSEQKLFAPNGNLDLKI